MNLALVPEPELARAAGRPTRTATAIQQKPEADISDHERYVACDDRYYAGSEPIADRLFTWIGTHYASIRVGT